MATAVPTPAPRLAALAPLLRLLAGVRRQTRRWIWVESLALAALWCAAAFWLSLAADWLVEPPGWVRAAMLGCGLAGLAWILAVKLAARLAAPLPDDALALVVERAHPQFRDSLSTAVALGRPRTDAPSIDPGLLERTAAEAAAVAGTVRPAAVFRRKRLGGLALAALASLGTIATLAVAVPAVARTWTRRMVLLADEPWPRRVTLEAEGFDAGVRTVARGSDVDVVVRATAAGRLPDVVELRSRTAAGWRTDRMGTRGGAETGSQSFGHVIKGVTEDLALEVRGGDARLRDLRLRVVESPALESLAVEYVLPAYLGGGTRQTPGARLVQVPRGSRVRLVCTATKPLADATLSIRPASAVAPTDEPGRVLARLAADGGTAPRAVEAVIDDLDGASLVTVDLADTDGLVNREPITFVVAAIPDEPPQPSLRLRGISTAVTPAARIPLVGTIADDHGVAGAEVRLAILADSDDADEALAAVEHRLAVSRAAGGAPLVELPAEAAEVVALGPLAPAVGGRLQLAVEARDTCGLAGGPNLGRSDAWTLDVVTPEALQAMLEAREIVVRRRYEAAIDDLAQARDRLAGATVAADPGPVEPGDAADEPSAAGAPGRFGEAAARATGETGEIAGEFRLIHLELANNAVLTPEVEERLVDQIAAPLEGLAANDLPALARTAREAGADQAAVAVLVARADDALARMRAVLDRMMELESFNEVVERLRDVIRTQEQIRADTLERQKQRAREALEGP